MRHLQPTAAPNGSPCFNLVSSSTPSLQIFFFSESLQKQGTPTQTACLSFHPHSIRPVGSTFTPAPATNPCPPICAIGHRAEYRCPVANLASPFCPAKTGAVCRVNPDRQAPRCFTLLPAKFLRVNNTLLTPFFSTDRGAVCIARCLCNRPSPDNAEAAGRGMGRMGGIGRMGRMGGRRGTAIKLTKKTPFP